MITGFVKEEDMLRQSCKSGPGLDLTLIKTSGLFRAGHNTYQ